VAPAVPAADAGEAAGRIIRQTNAFRQAQKLEPVKESAALQATAREFARFMAQSGKYSHTADGREPAQRAAAQGYEACIVAENIARVYRSSGYEPPALAREMVEGWKASPEHRKAMLDPAVTQTGVAVARSAQGRYYGVQLFGRPKSEAIRFSLRNTTGQSVSYRAGERRLALAPRVERTHTVCRRLQLRIDAGQAPFTARPAGGERYTIVERNGALAIATGR